MFLYNLPEMRPTSESGPRGWRIHRVVCDVCDNNDWIRYYHNLDAASLTSALFHDFWNCSMTLADSSVFP